MLITRPIVQRLSPAIREATSQVTDGTVVVPSLFSFVGLPPEPVLTAANPAPLQNSSFGARDFQNNPASSPSLITNQVQIGPGYWRLSLRGCYTANFPGTTAFGDFIIAFNDANGGWGMATFYAIGGTQIINHDVEILFQAPLPQGVVAGRIQCILGATGVGNSHKYDLTIIGSRLL